MRIYENVFNDDRLQDIELEMEVNRAFVYDIYIVTHFRTIRWDVPMIHRLYGLLFNEMIGWSDVKFIMELIFDT